MNVKNILFKTALAVTFSLVVPVESDAQTTTAGSSIQFPQSFKLDAKLLAGMHIQPINKDVKEALKISENPGTVCNETGIQRLMSSEVEDAKCIYYELYRGKGEDDGDAGVRVVAFNSEDGLQRSLNNLVAQGNTAYLVKDTYLIALWSDDPSNSETQLASMSSYYQHKIGATIYEAKASDAVMEAQTADTPTYEGLEFGVDSTAEVQHVEAPVNAKPSQKSKKKK